MNLIIQLIITFLISISTTELLTKKGFFIKTKLRLENKKQLDQKFTIMEKIIYELLFCHFCSGSIIVLILVITSILWSLELAFWQIILAIPFGLLIGLYYEIVEALQRSNKE